MKRFYLVWSPTGRHPPRFRHADPAAATTEAERLARTYPAHEFFVLAAVSRSWQPDNITERLTVEPGPQQAEDDIPF